MRTTRHTRLLAALGAVALLLTACGGADTADPDVSEAMTAAEQAEEDDGPRTVTHAMGETEVPADPQRVVVLDSPHLDAALSLGVTPVGAVQSSVDEGLPEYLGDRTDGIEIVGTITEPDLEKIASVEPDLILSAKVRHEDVYPQLSEIAPTVFTESSGTSFKEGLATIADGLDRSEELETQLEEYEARAREVGEAVGAEGTEATIVRFLPGETRLYGPETFSGTVLTDIGFELGDKGFDDNPYSMAMISPEQAELAEGDVIFATTYGAPDETTLGEMQPLLEELDAEVYEVDDRQWMLGIGLIGVEQIFSDVEELLGEEQA